VEPHQRRILARVADEIAHYRSGQLPIQRLLNNVYGLFEAAELRDAQPRSGFLDLYYALSSADDARQPWMPAGLRSDQDVEVALANLEAWATAIQASDTDDPVQTAG
jgi:hypothetical protein